VKNYMPVESGERELVERETAYLRSWGWAQRAVAFASIYYALVTGIFMIMQSLGIKLSQRALSIGHHIGITTGQGFSVVTFLSGVFMFFLAYHLWLRKRAASLLLSALLFAKSLLNLVAGRDFSVALACSFFSIILLMSAKEFKVKPDPTSFKRFKSSLAFFLLSYFGLVAAVLYLLKNKLGMSSDIRTLTYQTLMIAAGENGTARFNGWMILLKDLLSLVAIMGLFRLASLLLSSHYEEVKQSPEEHRLAKELVARYGSDSLAYFNTRDDKNLFFHAGTIFMAYRRIGNVAVISGDPVGPPELVPVIMKEFEEYCFLHGWRMASIGASADMLHVYRGLGLKALCIGEEAVVGLDDFSLEGRRMKTLRHAVTKLTKMGVTMEFQFNVSIPSSLKYELTQLSSEWREGTPETGFSMGLGRLLRYEDQDCLLAIARDADSRPIGFLHLVPMYPRVGYSLDIARTVVGATNGLNEFMLARAALFLRKRGYKYMSLHFCGLSQCYRENTEERSNAFLRAIAKILSICGVPSVSLYRFDKKFQPYWHKRYVIYQSLIDLPFIASSGLVVESVQEVSKRYRKKRLLFAGNSYQGDAATRERKS
jgi:lysyl-tRNA synthetase class 2